VSVPDFVVVEVVRRRDLHAARAEFLVDVFVGNDRNLAPGKRQAHVLADEMLVALIVGVHRDRRVAEHCLGSGRRDDEIPGATRDRIADVPKVSRLFLRDHFEIAHRREQHRIPVDEAFAAVDQAFFVQPHEDFRDGTRQTFVHREALARPIDRGAHAAQLFRDRVTRLFFPLPHAFDEKIAPEIMARFAFDLELALDDHLRRNAGVIGADLPERVVALHAVIADERIHQRVLECVAHVQTAGHVRRRDHDAVRLS
jgi:hypothetical protein